MTDKTAVQPDELCKAQGKNYGLDCVTGAVYFEGRMVAYATNCVFCGKENEP
jgi:hypothetical protein